MKRPNYRLLIRERQLPVALHHPQMFRQRPRTHLKPERGIEIDILPRPNLDVTFRRASHLLITEPEQEFLEDTLVIRSVQIHDDPSLSARGML
ncbi:hypothetical protein [Saccharopolyspora phatthalungensis]|uniref:Uncharacterized protein n=1 Tax=Saccharopolyspora phatthalungensis TaxID=664693 RepID=A0A840QF89_9PSEU|nr:hypothetical protein [Saccharopolyspora phatthalungensis]MBB5157249.1 hypothetical protein [Saccharopolyspora phatthalungensis]